MFLSLLSWFTQNMNDDQKKKSLEIRIFYQRVVRYAQTQVSTCNFPYLGRQDI